MASKIIALLYIVSAVVLTLCTPLGAILVIFKACGASSLSWIGSCIPFVVALVFVPIFVLSKALLDVRGGK